MASQRIVHFFDGAFLEGKAPRHHDLEAIVEAKQSAALVLVKFSQEVKTLALLPQEARQFAESLEQIASLADEGTED